MIYRVCFEEDSGTFNSINGRKYPKDDILNIMEVEYIENRDYTKFQVGVSRLYIVAVNAESGSDALIEVTKGTFKDLFDDATFY